MKTFFNWLLRNISNIFGLVGILLTIYFGAIYAPDWIKEAQNEKIRNAKNDIQQSVKELVFSDSTVDIIELQTLLTAKEIELKQTLPFSLKELLILTQESFMEDKFLPLPKRRELNKEIETLKGKLPDTTDKETQEAKSKVKAFGLVEILSIILSISAGLAGVISFYLKYRTDKEKQEEINNEVEQSTVEYSYADNAQRMEKEFIEVFKTFEGLELKTPNRDEGYDLYFLRDNKSYYIEFKFLNKSKVGLGTFKQFLYSVRDKPGEAWFIYNTDLTALVIREAKEFNDVNRHTIVRLIRVTNKDELKIRVKELLHTTMHIINGGV